MTKKINLLQLKETINNLDKETILKLIEVLSQKSQTPKKTKPVGKKRGRPKKENIDESKDEELPTNNIIQEEEEEPVETPTRQTRRPKNYSGGTKSGKGAQARVEPFVSKKRPNLFLKSKFANAHKDDILIDKKLRGNNEPTTRGVRDTLIEVECRGCGRQEIVSESLIYRDDDGIVYNCERCLKGKR